MRASQKREEWRLDRDTHTAQRSRRATRSGEPRDISAPDDPCEREADAGRRLYRSTDIGAGCIGRLEIHGHGLVGSYDCGAEHITANMRVTTFDVFGDVIPMKPVQ